MILLFSSEDIVEMYFNLLQQTTIKFVPTAAISSVFWLHHDDVIKREFEIAANIVCDLLRRLLCRIVCIVCIVHVLDPQSIINFAKSKKTLQFHYRKYVSSCEQCR